MDLHRALSAFDGLEGPQATPITTGLIHQTFDVRDESGRSFILQRINPVFSLGVLENIQNVTTHLAARGVTTLELMPSHGKPYADLGDDGCWRLMTKLPGVSFDRAESSEQTHSAGELVATFHRALLDYDRPLQPIGFPFHDTRQHIEDLHAALRECDAHPCHARVHTLAAELFEAAATLPELDKVPRRVVHGDLKLNNLLFEPARNDHRPEPVALIDLDTLARLPLAYDWGDALRSWCNRQPEDSPEAQLDHSFAQAALEGLMKTFETNPDREELESLSFALEIVSLELSIRFATDALREAHWAWDATRFERAGEHNLSRARGQFDLYLQARASYRERARHLGIG